MLALVMLLLAVVLVEGLGVLWPASLVEVTLADGGTLLGQRTGSQVNPDTRELSIQLKTGNREQDPQRQDFHWVKADAISHTALPVEAYVLERSENGDFYGYLQEIRGPDLQSADDPASREQLSAALRAVRQKMAEELAPIAADLLTLSTQLQMVRDQLTRLQYRRQQTQTQAGTSAAHGSAGQDPSASQIEQLEATLNDIRRESDRLVGQQQQRLAQLRQNVAVMKSAAGRKESVALVDIVRFYNPNGMGILAKCRHYVAKVGELLWDDPRESNTEGGLFPAIFGTVMLIFLMSATCFPLGVLAGIYLGEYSQDGLLVRIVRIAVNNLAGIPSIVYGIFGLGFFVYGIGGRLDQWLFPERVASGTPTFGTGGIFWASLTLGLLTVPVVIVATEEALRAIPRSIREGSLALGATKFQTLVRLLVPMASPGMMTGFILAMARAAGEVAPLMITGVVKLAPQLPVDGAYPFFHLDRKFMHLGFHIYDLAFQSPNVEASKPMVFVTTLLLLLIVLAMTSTAILLRNRMRKRYYIRTL